MMTNSLIGHFDLSLFIGRRRFTNCPLGIRIFALRFSETGKSVSEVNDKG